MMVLSFASWVFAEADGLLFRGLVTGNNRSFFFPSEWIHAVSLELHFQSMSVLYFLRKTKDAALLRLPIPVS